MRKIKVADYLVKIKTPDQMNPGRMIEGEFPFRVKDSILNLLFNPKLGLTSADLIKQNLLAMKIEQAKDGVLLEEEEYARVKKAFETFQGFQRNDVEMVRRVMEAEVVEVEQTK